MSLFSENFKSNLFLENISLCEIELCAMIKYRVHSSFNEAFPFTYECLRFNMNKNFY